MPVVRYIGGASYALRDGPTWTDGDEHEVDDGTADRLTDDHRFELVETTTDDDDADDDSEPSGEDGDEPTAADQIDDGVCPWCDEYEGSAVGIHASSAHPDAWDEYRGDA